jgi:RNA polymerase sigma-70 factor (ECF subfamily)
VTGGAREGIGRSRAALQEALRANGSDLTAYFERRVQPRDDAADLVAETMLQAWRRHAAMPDDAIQQRMWLFGIAAYVLANHRRATGRRAALAERLRATLGKSQHEETADHATAVAVRDAVERLPAHHRELVRLVHWDGFTLAQAAQLLGIAASTARGRYGKARADLRAALQDAPAVADPVTGPSLHLTHDG